MGGAKRYPSWTRAMGFARGSTHPTTPICPTTGKSLFAVKPPLQKYLALLLTQISSLSRAVSSHRGAYRDRHGRGMGCGGRGSIGHVRESQGGINSVSDKTACGRQMLAADGEVVWSWHPLLVLNLRRRVGPTGRRQALNPLMTVAT